MTIKYHYVIHGSAAQGQSWSATGTVETEKAGEFMSTPSLAMKDAFYQLTRGKAIYGKPGVGCSGPYRVTRMTIEEI